MKYYPNIIPVIGFSEPVSCWLHFIAAAFFLVAGVILVYRGRGNALRVTSLIIYSFFLVYLFSMSGVYHLLEPGRLPRTVLQRLDHAAIWTMIAATFIPLHIVLFRGFWRWGVLFIVWATAITGLVLEVVFFESFPEWLSLFLYLSLGWVGVVSAWKFKRHYSNEGLKYLLLGGIVYSLGGVMEYLRWPYIIDGVIGPHEVFHVFVILGAFLHWRFVFGFADVAIKVRPDFVVKVRPNSEYLVEAKGENIVFPASSKEEVYENLKKQISRKYRDYTRPKSIRLTFVQEELIDQISWT